MHGEDLSDECTESPGRGPQARSSLLSRQSSSSIGNLPHIQLPSWTFPGSTSPRSADLPRSATATLFTQRKTPQEPSISAPELGLATPGHGHERARSASQLLNNPPRSIFSSGPSNSTSSSNTAVAAMATPTAHQPIFSPRPVPSTPPPGSARKNIQYQTDLPQGHRSSRVSRAEKDADNPSLSQDHIPTGENRTSTPTALTKLFAAPEATPSTSRNGSYIRTASGTAYTRATAGETAPLPNHLYNRGLIGGKHSDITVHAFGTAYALHRLLLDRAPFFSSALSEPWFESSAKEMTLHPEEMDTNITQPSFELALKRLYGCHVVAEEDKEAIGLFATGCWLEMQDLIDASVASILRQMNTSKLASMIKLVTHNYYGKHGERILASSKAMLCREGWEMPLRYWDDIPGDVAREIIGGDGFFVPGEWERFMIAKKVLDRKVKNRAVEAGLFEPNGRPQRAPLDALAFHSLRFDQVSRKASFSSRLPDTCEPWLTLYTSPDVSALLTLLEDGIHYVHLSFEQLQKIRDQRDVLGLPLMPDRVINDALWMQMELRQRIVNAPETEDELGLSRPAEENVENATSEAALSRGGFNKKGKEQVHDDWDHDDDDESDTGNWAVPNKPRRFWIPNIDSTSVMGGGSDAALYATPSSNRPFVPRLSASIDPVDVQWASDFTASASERSADRHDQASTISYTHYPPFRFAAEFPNPRNLKEKKRVYSRTVWYAGSLWNVYIQKVETTKNTQLGVYLHRAKEREPHEDHNPHRSGSVDERIGQVELLMRRNRHRRPSRTDLLDEDHGNSSNDPDATLLPPEQTTRSTLGNLLRVHPAAANSSEASSLTKSSQTPLTPGANPFAHNPIPGVNSDSDNEDAACANRESSKTQNSVPIIPAYVDGRPTIKTYFKIYSPSKGGRMLSVYESSPDSFNFSQSWGWKSSTMVLDDGLCGLDGSVDGPNVAGSRSKDGRLRFMVVIGNV